MKDFLNHIQHIPIIILNPHIKCIFTTGALSWMLIVPLDVIKSRIQADDVKNPQYKVFKPKKY